MKIEFSAFRRDLQGTGASRRLRRAGRVPGILYGADKPAQPIELDHNDLFQHLRHESFHASILTMNLDGQNEQVLLRDVQMHPWKREVAHVDFQRVSKDRKIHMKVPLHFINAEISPGVKLSGGIVSHVLTELDISCLPADLPEYIEVDLGNLALGHSIHLTDLKLPNGVEAVLHKGENPVVATVAIPRALVVEEEAVVAPPMPGEEAEAAAPGAEAPAAGEKKEPEKKESEKK